MAYVTMKQMLETGVHFGHQTRRWNPKMRPYIFGARNGIHIIDLQQTVKMFQKAHDFIAETVAQGGKVMFVGTKPQAREIIKQEAERVGMYSVTHRWMGGTLTNFQTIRSSIQRLKKLETMFEDGTINRFVKKEIVRMQRDVEKLNLALGGIKDMEGLPQAAFIIDPNREDIAVQECRKLNIPVVAVVDTNCDPDLIDFIIPGNDDAIRAIKLFSASIADACSEGAARMRDMDEAAEKAADAALAQAAAESEETEAEREQDATEEK
ncbi:30S ribosomal protein S2 [Desulfonatronum thioautotrophicum]|uniref:30S ribosomal protein S2 n=1 Tax=Desulfonatronum thioautotrophicum TaxID=617001 RepID=UPI0005EB466E|nr:30S ribosomal protein S2 [Desulfonatronum thioautotrophicum]